MAHGDGVDARMGLHYVAHCRETRFARRVGDRVGQSIGAIPVPR
jgi:hypothetical protein